MGDLILSYKSHFRSSANVFQLSLRHRSRFCPTKVLLELVLASAWLPGASGSLKCTSDPELGALTEMQGRTLARSTFQFYYRVFHLDAIFPVDLKQLFLPKASSYLLSWCSYYNL